MKQILLIFLILLLSKSAIAQDDSINWASDLAYIKRELPEKHYDLFFKQSQADFELEMNILIASASTLSDYQILDHLSQIIAKVGDSHTHIDYGRFNKADKILPFRLYWFSDGLYITHTRVGYERFLGHKLTEINGYAIEQIADSLSSLIAIDNEATIKHTIPRMIGFVPHLEFFSFSSDVKIDLTTIDLKGVESISSIDKTELKYDKLVRYEPDSMSLCWYNRNTFFTNVYLEKDSILYIQYNRCWSRELERILGSRKRAKTFPSFNDFQKEIFEHIESKEINKLVFDLRFNVGGSSPQGTRLIKKLAEFESVNNKDKLYVITGMATYSSGIINVMDFKENTNATFVGEPTGGRPNHYGEIKYLTLPVSGLKISYSTKYFNKYSPDSDSFYPDIEIETSFDDYKNGIDPVFEYIKTQ